MVFWGFVSGLGWKMEKSGVWGEFVAFLGENTHCECVSVFGGFIRHSLLAGCLRVGDRNTQ